jgi:hypothetical protein
MYRHFAMGRSIRDHEAFERSNFDPNVLLDLYDIPRVEVPVTIPGNFRAEVDKKVTKRGNREVTNTSVLTTCGGVNVRFHKPLEMTPDAGGATQRTGGAVLDLRPTPTAPAWAVAPGASQRN